jgi:hypothetical protein
MAYRPLYTEKLMAYQLYEALQMKNKEFVKFSR